MSSLQLVGFESDSESFLLRWDDSQDVKVIKRNIRDLQALQRLTRPKKYENDLEVAQEAKLRNKVEGIPMKKFENMSLSSWLHESGNNDKNCRFINLWLRSVCDYLKETLPNDLNNFLDDEIFYANKEFLKQRRKDEAHSKNCQQYFCSSTNIETLLSFAVPPNDSTFDGCLFIEPSCGNGRVMNGFLQRGHIMVGCEIDEVAYKTINLIDSSGSVLPVEEYVLLNDFLKTTVDEYLSVYRNCLLSRNKKTSSDDNSILKYDCDNIPPIVIIGCPPYAHSADLSLAQENACLKENEKSLEAKEDMDILLRFLSHFRVLGAVRLVLLLPKRCAAPSFIEKAKLVLSQSKETERIEQTTQRDEDREVNEKSKSFEWVLEESVEADSSFLLKDREIKQPSIIQVWQRQSVSLKGNCDQKI